MFHIHQTNPHPDAVFALIRDLLLACASLLQRTQQPHLVCLVFFGIGIHLIHIFLFDAMISSCTLT